jgi:hypothetical protein
MRSDLNHKKTYPQIRLFKNFIIHNTMRLIYKFGELVNPEECDNKKKNQKQSYYMI